MDARTLQQILHSAFPPFVLQDTITPHQCEECDALRSALEGRRWDEIDPALVDVNEGGLPLLSYEAYVAYLPAWLLRALGDPAGPVAGMLLVNLRHEPETVGFTPAQRAAVVEVARFIVA